MGRTISLAAICVVLIAALVLVRWATSPAFALNAVRTDSPNALRAYLLLGGDANLVTNYGPLVYVATEPNAGTAVLKLLLEDGAEPNNGLNQYTPLMNAASWCAVDEVRILIEAHADVRRLNARGQSALETVCPPENGAAYEATVALLRRAMASNNRWRGP